MMNGTDSQESQKQLALYTALVEAWIETRMEKDKTLLGLATAGIGLLATLLMTVGPTSARQLWLYGFAGLAFIGAIVTAVWIFDRNSQHLEDVIQQGIRGQDPLLVKLDLAVFVLFVVGVVLTGAIALSSGLAKVRTMGHENAQSQKVVVPDQTRSLSGVGNLATGNSGSQSGRAGTQQQGGGAGTGTSATQQGGSTQQQGKQ